MNLVLAPPWILQALTESGKDLKDLFNIEILQSTLSSEDLNFYIFLNQSINQIIPAEVVASFETGNAVALNIPVELLDSLKDGIMTYSVPPAPFKSQWLFGPLSDSLPLDKLLYQIVPTLADTLVLVPDTTTGLSVIGMVNELMFHLNGRLLLSDLAKTAIFRYYLLNA
jgi:hypothetical protein